MRLKEITAKGTWTEEYFMQRDLLFPYQNQILLTSRMQNSKIGRLQIKDTVVFSQTVENYKLIVYKQKSIAAILQLNRHFDMHGLNFHYHLIQQGLSKGHCIHPSV